MSNGKIRSVYELDILKDQGFGNLNKTVTQYTVSRFPAIDHLKRPVGLDKNMLTVLKQYALNPNELDQIVDHLRDVDYGPRQVYGAHVQNVERFLGEHAPAFRWNEHYQKALKEVYEMIKPKVPLEPLDYYTDGDVMDALAREDTHAGLSYWITGDKKKGEYRDGIKDNLLTIESEAILKGSFNRPYLLGERYQCSGGYSEDGEAMDKAKYKERSIMMVDIYSTASQSRWAVPFQRHLGTIDEYAGGKTPRELFQIISRRRAVNDYWYSFDMSKYDASIPGWLMSDALNLIIKCFRPLTEREEKLWRVVVNDLIYKMVVGPNGELWYLEHGIGSGEKLTQTLGTVIHMIVDKTEELAQHPDNKFSSSYCSDDGLVFTVRPIDIERYSSYLKHNFGIDVSVDKSTHGTRREHPTFLSRFWTNSGIYRHPYVLCAKMLYPERYRDYKRNLQLKPELIFYSYILTYSEGMRNFFRVDEFLHDHGNLMKNLSEEALAELSGFYGYLVRYEGLKPHQLTI